MGFVACMNAIGRISSRIAAGLVIFSAVVLAGYIVTAATLPGADVTIFVPGAIPTSVPNNAAPAFAPDGHTVFFFQSQARRALQSCSRRRPTATGLAQRPLRSLDNIEIWNPPLPPMGST